MRCFITTYYCTKLTGYFSDAYVVGVTSGNNDALEHITLRKDAEQFTRIINNTHRAYVSSSHKLCRFLDRGCCLRRVRLTVANHVSDQHVGLPESVAGWVRAL